MKIIFPNDEPEGKSGRAPDDPLEGVFDGSGRGPVFEMQTGMFRFGRNRALQSGAVEPQESDIRMLEDHARAIARALYRDRYDPTQHAHDAMHEVEYQRDLALREETELAEQHAIANFRDAEARLARTPKAGPKPAAHLILVAAFVVVISLTVGPTLHDSVFETLADDLLAWFGAALCALAVAGMLTLAILGGRRTKWTWIGVVAGVALGIGLGAVRLSSAEDTGQVVFGLGLTVVEIAAVLLLEWLASGLRTSEADWELRQVAESEATAARDAAQAEAARLQMRLKELNDAIAKKIALVEDRHYRNVHIVELEAAAIKAVLDGYNAGIAENVGRIRGVLRRSS